MGEIIQNRFSGRLSIVLIIAMLLPIAIPAHAADSDVGSPIVISNLPGECKISVGNSEGIRIGTRGIISRDGLDIAKYEVTKVEWGYSRVTISDLAAGESVRVGDRARITSIPDETASKKGSKGSSKALVALLAVGAIIALAGGHGGHGGASAATTSSSITVSSQKSSIPADGSSTTVINATIDDAHGTPIADGTTVTFSSTLGTILPAQATTTGGVATATLTAGSTTGTATVTATSGGKSNTTHVSLVAETSVGRTVDVAAGPASIQVLGSGGAQTQSTITATCRDTLNNLANGGTVTFETSLGSIVGSATINASGVATTTFSSNVTGDATITASWSGATGTTHVTVTPGPPHAVTVQCTPSAIQCDGNSFATIKATVLDIAGNPVADGTIVTFAVQPDINGGGNGTITPTAQTINGVANALIFSKTGAGAVSTPGTATVVAQVSSTGQPAGVPAPAVTVDNHTTQVQFISLDVAEIHLGANPLNIRGLDVVNNTSAVVALVYDAQHNPVADGTAVYFTSDHGMIFGDTGSAGNVTMSVTKNGKATASLVTDAPGPIGFNGLVSVTATCGAVSLTEPGLVIFSGWPSLPHCTVDMNPTILSSVGGQASIVVTALDVNNNPIVDGTQIKAVSSKGAITANNGNSSSGGVVTFTLTTSTDATSPTETGAGIVTITIESGGLNPETGGGPVVIQKNFTVN